VKLPNSEVKEAIHIVMVSNSILSYPLPFPLVILAALLVKIPYTELQSSYVAFLANLKSQIDIELYQQHILYSKVTKSTFTV
jgi:hypothetical protein